MKLPDSRCGAENPIAASGMPETPDSPALAAHLPGLTLASTADDPLAPLMPPAGKMPSPALGDMSEPETRRFWRERAARIAAGSA